MEPKRVSQLPIMTKRPGLAPVVGDRSSSLPQNQLLSVSPKRARDAILEEIESAKRQRLAAKESRDSLNVKNLEWWTQDKIMHQASIIELNAQLELERTNPESKQQIEDSVTRLEASLIDETIAAADSRKEELKKQLALIEAAKSEENNITPSTLSQSTKVFLSIVTEILFPTEPKRDKTRQATWKTALIIRYNALSGCKPSSMIGKTVQTKKEICSKRGVAKAWCPIMQQYLPVIFRTAAHIVPHRLGQTGFELFFGKDTETDNFNKNTWSLNSGLIVSSTIETLLDDGTIVITPCSSDPDEIDFETRVLNYEAVNEELAEQNLETGCQFVKDLHGRRLVFKNSERPGKRYLYLMYCAALYKASLEGKNKVVQTELSGSKDIWATPAPYIRAHILRAIAANMGHDTSMLHSELHAVESKIDSALAAAAEVSERSG